MPRAVLDADPRTEANGVGHLRYEAPDGKVDVIAVTTGPSFERRPDAPKYERDPVWHVDIGPDRIVVTPSIDVRGRYHTASTVTFDLVEDL